MISSPGNWPTWVLAWKGKLLPSYDLSYIYYDDCFVKRYSYLEMAHLVLVRSGYEDHLHKLSDLKSCLVRIQREEADTVDRKKATEICESFSCFQK